MSELGQLLTLEYGEALPAHARAGHGYPVYGSNGIVGFHDDVLVDGPGIVVGRKGSVGKVVWSELSFWPIDTTYYVRSAGDDMGWLYRVLAWLPLEELDSSTGVPGLNRNDVYRMEIFRPSAVEQRKIAQILDTLDTQIRQTEALIAKLERIKQGLLTDLLTRGIDQNGQLRPTPDQAPQLYKESPLGRIPREWEIKPAHLVCAAVIDCKNRTPPETTTGHPVIRTPNVRDGRFVHSGLTYTDALSYEIWTQRGKPRPGDVLITREAPVGEACLVPADIANACLGQRMMMYQPDPEQLHNDFMLTALLSPAVQCALLDLAGGSTVGHVRVGDIRNLLIPLPGLEEQARIAESYKELEHKLKSEEGVLAKLASAKNGLMDDLLTGRVRVTPLLDTAEEAHG